MAAVLTALVLILEDMQGVTGYLIFKPSYTSKWKTIIAQDVYLSHVTFYHSFREIPLKVQAEIKIRIDGKDYIFNAQGSAQIDDDHKGAYGGVICLYNETAVELFAPFGSDNAHGGIVYTGGYGWSGPLPSNRSLFTFGQVRVKAWRRWDFPRTAFFKNWTFVDVNDDVHVLEFDHKLDAYPDYVLVQVMGKWQNYVMEAQGSISVLEQYQKDVCVGGVMFGYSYDKIRVWIPRPYPSSYVSTVNLMFNADGWINSKWWIYETQGYIRIFVWTFENSSKLEFSERATDVDFNHPIPLGDRSLDVDSKIILVEAEVLEGPNTGYCFPAVGTTFNDGWYGANGGLLYATEQNNVLLWRPTASENGYIFHLHRGGLFGNNETYQKTDDVIVRITVWDEYTIDDIRCATDFFEDFENVTNSNVQVFGNKYRDRYTAKCRYGYRYVSGIKHGRCRRHGDWSGIKSKHRITCKEIRCPELPNILNGRVKIFGNSLDDLTVYECDDGYIMNDTSLGARKCLQNSTWDSIQPTCQRTTCSNEELSVNFADINISGVSFGDTVTYRCQQGYPYISGDLNRTCQNDGTWSGTKPVCKFCDCFCKVNKTTQSNETLTEMLNEIRKELKVEATNTSKARRKKISIKDDRPSARSIGAIGIALLVIVFVTVLIPDIPRLVLDIKQGISNIFCTGKGSKIQPM